MDFHEQAVALVPKHPDRCRALGDYDRRLTATPARAVEQYVPGLALAPTDADLPRGLGLAEQAMGQWKEAEEHLRGSQSQDPRSANTAQILGGVLPWTRRYDEAEPALKHALSLEAYWQHQLARMYILVGEPEKALDQLEPLLRVPYYLAPGWLRIDPTFNAIREHPRFKKLIEGTE